MLATVAADARWYGQVMDDINDVLLDEAIIDISRFWNIKWSPGDTRIYLSPRPNAPAPDLIGSLYDSFGEHLSWPLFEDGMALAGIAGITIEITIPEHLRWKFHNTGSA